MALDPGPAGRMGKQDKTRLTFKLNQAGGPADAAPSRKVTGKRKERDRDRGKDPEKDIEKELPAQGLPKELKQLPPFVPPQQVLEMEERERQLVSEHRNIERQIYELESKYLSTSNPCGNAMKGYAGLTVQTADRSKRGAIKMDDRLFSSSSLTGQLLEATGLSTETKKSVH